MDLLEISVVALCILYIGYLIFERLYFIKIRKSFIHVIHVNGIRGKSTTTRLIDAGLRNCGFRVFSKTTGTIPTMINVENQELVIKRRGLANIREQYRMMYKAYKEKAEILVIECMAVNPELQYITQHKMLNADITIITNVLLDHLGDMGNDLDEIANALAQTIPDKGYVITSDDSYNKMYSRIIGSNDVKIIMAKEYVKENEISTVANNLNMALEVADILSLDKEIYYQGMKNYYQDPGAYRKIKLQETIFINALSVNDPTSISRVYEEVLKKYPPERITILNNNRSDRPTRMIQNLDLLGTLSFNKLIIVGSNKPYIKRYIKKNYPKMIVKEIKNIKELEREDIIFAIGNISGLGMKILQYFEKNGVNYDD